MFVHEKHSDDFLQQSQDMLKTGSLLTMISSTIWGDHDEGYSTKYFYNHRGQRINFLGNILEMFQPKIQTGNCQVKTSVAAAAASLSGFASIVEADQHPSLPVFKPSNQMEVSSIFL